MPMLERSEGALWYEVIDIAPPWVAPRETILFLHGLAIDSGIWAGWLPALVDRYRIVRMDLRSFGRSFVPAPGAAWSMAAIAKDVRDVMAAAGIEKVHFVGESTGGTVGLHLAAYQPACLKSLTMVSAAHRGGSIGRARQLRDDVTALGMDRWSETLMPLRFHEGAIPAPMWRWFHDVQRSAAPHACVDLVDMLVQVDLTDRLPEIATPTLIIAPDDSPFVSVESALERKRAMPNARLQVIAGARHGVAFSHGAACAEALRDFLTR
ncbi:MAG: alpha/beta fold hydrolase [Alphaproteobacteria bacterium]